MIRVDRFTGGQYSMDALLECLVILTKINHHPLSQDALLAGLPYENKLTTQLFVRAAERAKLSAKIFQRPLDEITQDVLPAVLILHAEKACILIQINPDQTADVIFPETPDQLSKIFLTELEECYSGEVIFITPAFMFEKRTEALAPKKDPSAWFWGALWRYRYIYLQVVLAALFINLFSLVSPLFVMNVYDRVVPNYATTTLWVLAIGVFIIFTFDFILRTLRSYLIDISGKKADTLMASAIFQHVLGMRMEHKPTSVGAFVSNIREFEVLREFFTSATLTTIIDLPFTIFFILLTWYIGGVVVVVPLVVVPLVIISALLLEKPLRNNMLLSLQGAMQKHAVLVESLSGLETIKSLATEGLMQKKWEQSVGVTAKYGLKARFFSGLVVNIANYAQQLVTIGVVIVGVYAIHDEALTLGGLIACSILSGRILAPLAGMANIFSRFQQARVALDNLDQVMGSPLERPEDKKFLHLQKIKGNIEFEDVCFQYPGQEGAALEKLSFKISAGERVAFIGRVGSGKSTVTKLLLGLYKPISGNIRIDGIDINQIDPVDLRKQVGYVSQDSVLFYGTIRDNIAIGMPTAEDAAIMEAARVSGADSFIHRHPSGYGMHVGERGADLSGGQRQTIAIARALLANPAVWLFDEPTSSMDNSSEYELIQRLAEHLQGKTVLLVTHRTALFPLVDRIIVMDTGHLVMDGPKDTIITALSQPRKGPTS